MIKNKGNDHIGSVCRHSQIMLMIVALANILIFWYLNGKIEKLSMEQNTPVVQEQNILEDMKGAVEEVKSDAAEVVDDVEEVSDVVEEVIEEVVADKE